jgi:hypothetical protein
MTTGARQNVMLTLIEFNTVVWNTTVVAVYALLKFLVGKGLDQLREYGAPSVHSALSPFHRNAPTMLLTLLVFQIVLTKETIHHTESMTLALSLQKFPRTAVDCHI